MKRKKSDRASQREGTRRERARERKEGRKALSKRKVPPHEPAGVRTDDTLFGESYFEDLHTKESSHTYKQVQDKYLVQIYRCNVGLPGNPHRYLSPPPEERKSRSERRRRCVLIHVLYGATERPRRLNRPFLLLLPPTAKPATKHFPPQKLAPRRHRKKMTHAPQYKPNKRHAAYLGSTNKRR